MYRKILVPVDGSRTSARGLLEAIRLAKSLGAKLRLVHIVEESSVYRWAGGVPFDIERTINILRADGEKIIAQAMVLTRKHGVEAESVIYDNVAYRSADIMIEDAKTWHADLIVMGTHGRRGVSRLVMGSDAEIVVRASPVPVLLVRFPEAKGRVKKGK